MPTPAPSSPSSPASPADSPARSSPLSSALTVILLAGLVVLFLRSCPRGSASGELHSSGRPHGDFVVQPVTCFTGGHWGFDGVWVVTETQSIGHRSGFRGGLKIVRNDSGGWNAFAENPNVCNGFKCEQRLVEPRHCRLFDVAVRSGWLRDEGHADIDCAFPGGGTLKASLRFSRCGAVPTGGEP